MHNEPFSRGRINVEKTTQLASKKRKATGNAIWLLSTKLFLLLCAYNKIVHPPERTAVEFYKHDHHKNLMMPTPEAPSSNLSP